MQIGELVIPIVKLNFKTQLVQHYKFDRNCETELRGK